MFAFGIGEQLEQLGNRNGYAIVTRTSVRIFGLVLAVLGCTEFVLVSLFFLAFDGVLLVNGSEEQIERLADKTLTTGGRSGDT